jgi:hypothetical protein
MAEKFEERAKFDYDNRNRNNKLHLVDRNPYLRLERRGWDHGNSSEARLPR